MIHWISSLAALLACVISLLDTFQVKGLIRVQRALGALVCGVVFVTMKCFSSDHEYVRLSIAALSLLVLADVVTHWKLKR
jgi:hypothetical protein